jgi:hypothetical protein
MIDLAGYLHWRPVILEAIDQRLYNAEWLDREVHYGRAHFWRSPNAAALTEIRIYPTGVADLHGLVAVGDVAEVRDILVPQAEAFGAHDAAASGSSSRAAPAGRSC